MLNRRVSLDFETRSEAQLVGVSSVGAYQYATHPSTRALMVAWRVDDGPYLQVDLTVKAFPSELEDLLLDPAIDKYAFNAAFERLITKHCLGIDTPYEGWKCSMSLASMQSFTGTLLDIGAAMGVTQDKLKTAEGKKLIQLFCQPQRITKKNPHVWRDRHTDPAEWKQFLDYNLQDVVAEDAIRDILLRFPIGEMEWDLYEEDQRINDRGLPINRAFVEQADIMSDRRRSELKARMQFITGLDNPNSGPQLLPYLKEEGYPFDDLKKDTIKKVLNTNTERLRNDQGEIISSKCGRVLRLRQQASRTSVTKYPRIMQRLSRDGNMRHCFQYGGAARTLRWSGRGPQPHNFVRTPKWMEADGDDATVLEAVADTIEDGDYDWLSTIHAEPMEALAGSMRSAIQAPPGHELRVCDLKAIESSVVAWLSGCKRLLNVFNTGMDPYKDFATRLYGVSYDAVTAAMRTIAKPAVLGCSYQLSGGQMREGKRTGLWAYAESMGVELTQQEARDHVTLFRETYHEIPTFWGNLESAALAAFRGKPTRVGRLFFRMRGPYLTIRLPSGRLMYYYRPKYLEREFEREDGTTYTRWCMSYMGRTPLSHRWTRVWTSGGKLCENVTQAVARDVLATGLLRAATAGFRIVGHVHDELITLARKGNNFHTVRLLKECMRSAIDWADGLFLDAEGYAARVYRKA